MKFSAVLLIALVAAVPASMGENVDASLHAGGVSDNEEFEATYEQDQRGLGKGKGKGKVRTTAAASVSAAIGVAE